MPLVEIVPVGRKLGAHTSGFCACRTSRRWCRRPAGSQGERSHIRVLRVSSLADMARKAGRFRSVHPHVDTPLLIGFRPKPYRWDALKAQLRRAIGLHTVNAERAQAAHISVGRRHATSTKGPSLRRPSERRCMSVSRRARGHAVFAVGGFVEGFCLNAFAALDFKDDCRR